MNLYLIRHAEAAPAGPDGDDLTRPLTDRGHAQARKLAAALRKRGVEFDEIITSPLLRARETADELLAGFAEPKPPLQVFDEIGFEVRPKKIIKFLSTLSGETFAIVGHQPGLSRFVAWLIGDKNVNLDLEKAGFAKVTCAEWEKGAATLVELVSPEWYG